MPLQMRKWDTKLLIGKAKWVIVPATSDPTVPCRIQISDIQRIRKAKDLFNTENADQDLGDDGGQTADRVFDEAVSEAEEEFAEMCTGMAFDELQEELQNVGEREASEAPSDPQAGKHNDDDEDDL